MRQIDDEVFNEIRLFLNRVGDGYIELSHDKVVGEYHYYKKKAAELKHKFREVETKSIKHSYAGEGKNFID